MVQVKKKSVENAIARAALKLFSESGFGSTKLSDIAAEARVGVGSVYSYFPSKLHLLYRVYRPWWVEQMTALESQVAMVPVQRDKLRTLLLGLWQEIPSDNPGLANSLMEALATDEPGSGKKNDLLVWTESRISAMLRDALPDGRRHLLDTGLIANLLMMAHNGYAINRRVGDLRDIESTVETFCDMIFGTAAGESAQSHMSRKTA